jgi:hypothetical protein
VATISASRDGVCTAVEISRSSDQARIERARQLRHKGGVDRHDDVRRRVDLEHDAGVLELLEHAGALGSG